MSLPSVGSESIADFLSLTGLYELVDDEETEVRVPIITADDITELRQNYLNEQAAKTHEYTVVGWLTTTVLLDSGLDEDHEQYSTTQTARHEFETYDRVVSSFANVSRLVSALTIVGGNAQEGQAAAADKNAHANDDGVIDKDEQKAIDKAHKKALESRHRGKMQSSTLRSGVWVKDGMKERIRKAARRMTGNAQKEETVASES